MEIMKSAREKLGLMKGEAGEIVLQVVLKINLGYLTFTNVCHVLNGKEIKG
jgi:hypothetical protein